VSEKGKGKVLSGQVPRQGDGAAGFMEMAMSKAKELWPPRGFISDESGQDLLEYALLLAVVALAGAAALLNMSSSTLTIWSVTNNNLAAANSVS
jgi:Flp pilus assembly pilin Flp